MRRKLEECPDGDKRTYLDLMVEKYITEAYKSGDGIAVRDLIDRFNGKPVQTVNASIFQDENPVYEAIKDMRKDAESKAV